MARPDDPRRNNFLAALRDDSGQYWAQHLEHVDLKVGQELHEQGRPQRHAYFPTSAVVALAHDLRSGASTEIAVVGNEGVVGISLFLGVPALLHRASVLISGEGFRISGQAMQGEFDRSGAVRRAVLRYTHALTVHIAQNAVCNRLHVIEQQLCGWLLHIRDRLKGNEVAVTQELIASMLGVRRESVTEAAGRLQGAGLIHYGRGHITVLNAAGLERRSCECRAVVKKEYLRLLAQEPVVRPADPGRRTWPAWKQVAQARGTPRREVVAMSEC